MADIYQDVDGRALTKKQWEAKRLSPEWTVKEYKGDKIWVRLAWIGKYDKALPSEYRHSHGIQVYNHLFVKETEWDEEVMIDKGWVLDPTASESARTKSAAEALYEDMLIKYTESFIDVDEDGEVVFVEEGNKLAPVVPGSSMLVDEEQIAAAAAAGVDLGGWS